MNWRLKDLRGAIVCGDPCREKGVCADWIPDPPPADHQGIMWVEVGCHGLVFFVWLSYLITIWNKVPFVQGLTLGSVLAMCLMVAALWRAGQILWQVKRAIIDPPGVSGIISSGELEP